MHSDGLDKKLVNLMQASFPLTERPYAELGRQLGIDEDEVILRIERLKATGIIRQIGPVMDARRLDYRTTLVAMMVPETRLDKAGQLIAEHPGVSHGYQRDHHFNVWVTMAVPSTADIGTEVRQLTESIGAEASFPLPAVRLFKIGTYFDMVGNSQETPGALRPPDGILPERVELSQSDRLVINELQQDLPLVPTPFGDIAARVGIDQMNLLAQCQSLLQRGIIRRFSASVNHRKAGFSANAMTCWVASVDAVTAAGRKLASLREVSHCYERKTNPLWPYNLFAMVHGHTREACENTVSDISHRISLADPVLLFSTKEFKKKRVKYLV